jgi:hypothetical protein
LNFISKNINWHTTVKSRGYGEGGKELLDLVGERIFSEEEDGL